MVKTDPKSIFFMMVVVIKESEEVNKEGNCQTIVDSLTIFT
jgi:hypothetical protein